MSAGFTEPIVKDGVLAWLEAAGWEIAHHPGIALDTSTGRVIKEATV
jgi:hypothetical protein